MYPASSAEEAKFLFPISSGSSRWISGPSPLPWPPWGAGGPDPSAGRSLPQGPQTQETFHVQQKVVPGSFLQRQKREVVDLWHAMETQLAYSHWRPLGKLFRSFPSVHSMFGGTSATEVTLGTPNVGNDDPVNVITTRVDWRLIDRMFNRLWSCKPLQKIAVGSRSTHRLIGTLKHLIQSFFVKWMPIQFLNIHTSRDLITLFTLGRLHKHVAWMNNEAPKIWMGLINTELMICWGDLYHERLLQTDFLASGIMISCEITLCKSTGSENSLSYNPAGNWFLIRVKECDW